jgi:D-hexose-6-phosphate mutarotase
MEPTGWLAMTCIETANVGENGITLKPGEHHVMETHIIVETHVPVEQLSHPPSP